MWGEGLWWKGEGGEEELVEGSHTVNESLVCLLLNLFSPVPTESMTDCLDWFKFHHVFRDVSERVDSTTEVNTYYQGVFINNWIIFSIKAVVHMLTHPYSEARWPKIFLLGFEQPRHALIRVFVLIVWMKNNQTI